MRVFISYSTEDREVASRVYADLLAAGAEVFQYGKTEKAGMSSWEQVTDWITLSDVFLVLISKNALKSRPVRAEVDHAHHRYVNFEKPELIPATIQAGADPPNMIARFARLDLLAYEPGITRLMRQLGLKKPEKAARNYALPRFALPDLNVWLTEYEKKHPEPDPISLWSRRAES